MPEFVKALRHMSRDRPLLRWVLPVGHRPYECDPEGPLSTSEALLALVLSPSSGIGWSIWPQSEARTIVAGGGHREPGSGHTESSPAPGRVCGPANPVELLLRSRSLFGQGGASATAAETPPEQRHRVGWRCVWQSRRPAHDQATS